MKHLILIVFVLISASSFSQKQITLRQVVNPNTTLITTTKTIGNSKMDFTGNEEKLKQIKGSGGQFPMVILSESTSAMKSVLGSRGKDGRIPTDITFTEVSNKQTVNGKAVEAPNNLKGLVIGGSYDSQMMFRIDTVRGEKVTDDIRKAMTSVVETMTAKMAYPKQPLKVGDSFDLKMPMKIPVGGGNTANLSITMHYVLKDIKNNVGFFDITTEVTMDLSVDQGTMKASGNGTGTAEYDATKNLMTKSDTFLDMTMTVNMDDIALVMKMKSKTLQTIVVE